MCDDFTQDHQVFAMIPAVSMEGVMVECAKRSDTPMVVAGNLDWSIDEGARLNDASDRTFDEGTASRHQADEYIRTTVVLATVLFLLALSQRFLIRRVRIAVVVLAAGLMIYGLVTIAAFPRL